MKMRILYGVFLGLLCAGPALADTHYVDLNNTNPAPPYTNGWGSAANTITAAVYDAATVANDVVLVNTGVYVLGATINMNKSIAIIANSTNRQDVVVDGAGTNRCLYIGAGAAITGRLEGFTIRGGYVLDTFGGGGILCYPKATAGNIFTIANCTITSNFSLYGGGISVYSNSIITNCLIIGNTASNRSGGAYGYANGGIIKNCLIVSNQCQAIAASMYGGGGIYNLYAIDCRIIGNTSTYGGGGTEGGTTERCVISNNLASIGGGCAYGTVRNSTIVANSATLGGGGIYNPGVVENCIIRNNSATSGIGGGGVVVYDTTGGMIRNCLIIANSANNAGGFYTRISGATFQNCTITRNSAGASGGGIYCNATTLTNWFENTVSYGNTAVTAGSSNWYNMTACTFTNCCTAPTNNLSGSGNVDGDPLFVNPTGDFHVKNGSRCINAGIYRDWMTNAVDLDGRRRIIEGAVDMGAYEFLHVGCILTIR